MQINMEKSGYSQTSAIVWKVKRSDQWHLEFSRLLCVYMYIECSLIRCTVTMNVVGMEMISYHELFVSSIVKNHRFLCGIRLFLCLSLQNRRSDPSLITYGRTDKVSHSTYPPLSEKQPVDHQKYSTALNYLLKSGFSLRVGDR